MYVFLRRDHILLNHTKIQYYFHFRFHKLVLLFVHAQNGQRAAASRASEVRPGGGHGRGQDATDLREGLQQTRLAISAPLYARADRVGH